MSHEKASPELPARSGTNTSEGRAEQVELGWEGEGSDERAAAPPPRGGVARSGRSARPSTRRALASLPPDNELWDVHATRTS
jgi:hypothetical protein